MLARFALCLAALAATAALCGAALLVVLLHALRPAGGEWTEAVQIGPWERPVAMPALLRMATHPFTLGLLQGRRLDTRFGPVHVLADGRPGVWRVVCAPCSMAAGPAAGGGGGARTSGTLPIGTPPSGVAPSGVAPSGARARHARVSDARVLVPRLELELRRSSPSALHGSFALGEAPQRLRGQWRARLADEGAVLDITLHDAPIAQAFALFADVVPELERARIEGRIGGRAQLRLPSRGVTLEPRVEGFRVSGLGTEALLGARPACGRGARAVLAAPGGSHQSADDASASFGAWLPRAVVAAEDQRFHEHGGFDLVEWMAAAPAERLRGASTLSQQLAKLVYTGDRPTHARKLRELLYAVELDRTLGKARVLNLYLALAPWGDGRCGAHDAARELLGKPAAALSPVEAAWLASLLRNPDATLAQAARSGAVDARRVAWVLDGMRPMDRARRAASRRELDAWRPGWMAAPPVE